MKNTPSLLRSLLLLTLLAACRDRSTRDTAPQSSCRIQKITSASTSSVYNGGEQTTYAYDTQGNLTRRESALQVRYLDAQLAQRANTDQALTDEYTYDAEGYLLTATSRTVNRYVNASGQPATDQSVTTTRYFYANGRPVSYTQTTETDRSSTTATGTLEYDGAGNLLRHTRSLGANAQSVYMFSGDRLTDYVEKISGTESRPFTLQNGLVTSYTIPGGWRGTYEYDGQQRLVKMEEYVNGKLNSYYTQTYADGKPATTAQPALKGFPAVGYPGNTGWYFGKPGVLTGKKQYYANSQTGQAQFFSESLVANQLNGQGFVTSATKQDQFKNPQTLPQVVNTTTTYEYTDCN